MYAAASKAGVLERDLLDQVKPFLTSIKPRTAVFDHNYVKKLDGPNVKKGKNKMDLAEQVRADMNSLAQLSQTSTLEGRGASAGTTGGRQNSCCASCTALDIKILAFPDRKPVTKKQKWLSY